MGGTAIPLPDNSQQLTMVFDLTAECYATAMAAIEACMLQTCQNVDVIAAVKPSHLNCLSHITSASAIKATLIPCGEKEDAQTILSHAIDSAVGRYIAVFLDARATPCPRFAECTLLSSAMFGVDTLFVPPRTKFSVQPPPFLAATAATVASTGPLTPIFVFPNEGAPFGTERNVGDDVPRRNIAPAETVPDLKDVTALWARGWLFDEVWQRLTSMAEFTPVVLVRDPNLATWDVSAETVTLETYQIALVEAYSRDSRFVTRSRCQGLTPISATKPSRHRRKTNHHIKTTSGDGPPGVLLCLPFRVNANLSLRLLDHMQNAGTPCYITTQFPHPEGYREDNGAWSQREERIFPLWQMAARDNWAELVEHIIRSRNIGCLWQAGSPDIYPVLPYIRRAFPKLKIVDQIFNPVGHTRKLVMFERMFDSIIIENAEMRDFLVAAGVAQSKIVTVENGIDLDKFSRSALPSASIEEQRSAWGLDPKVKYIVGYIGRMSPEKNPDGFVEIAKGITALRPDVGILIAGDGPMEAAVREAAKSLPPGRVHVQSFIEDVRVPIAACDVLVVPSKVDGRPATVMESAAMGVPVVGSRVGAIHDLIVENETGLTFASGKLNDAVAALEVILSPEVLKIMRIKCREHAVEKFDHRQMFYEYHRIMAPWRFTRPDLPSTDVLMESYPLCAIS